MAESEESRERRALDLAEKRGAEAAQLKGRLDEHERQIKSTSDAINETGRELHNLREEVRKVVAQLATATAVAEARALDFKKATENQVSTRTFVVSLVVAVIALGSLIAGFHP